MALFFALIAAVAIIACGVLFAKLRRRNMEYDMLSEDYTDSLEINQALRDNNRNATKAWSSERRRLWAQARDAENHARDMQEFHLHNEADLRHELAGAHGIIELLMATYPKEYSITPVTFEVQRIFRPIAQMTKPDSNKQDPNVF